MARRVTPKMSKRQISKPTISKPLARALSPKHAVLAGMPVSLVIAALLTAAVLTAQTPDTWEKLHSQLLAKADANAHGYSHVGFNPEIMSIPGKPFTASRTFTDRSKQDGSDSELTAECIIARDSKGRVHYEMPFEKARKGQLVIAGISVQLYDPVEHTLTRYELSPDRSLPAEPIAQVRKLKLMSELSKPLAETPQQHSEQDSQASDPPPETAAPSKPGPQVPVFVPTPDETGLQSFDGVAVAVHRVVMKTGPKHQFLHVRESDFSPEYAVDMRRVDVREPSGETVVETKNIVNGQPDAWLFQIPPGFEVRSEK
jgi:hypothetical protein